MKPVVHQYEDKLLEFAYGELPRPEAEAVEAHLRGCAKCTEALSHISVVRHTMGQLPMEAAPDAGLESLLAYAEQHAQRNAGGAPAKKPWWRGLVLGLATVASVLVAGVVAYRASDDFNPDPTRDLRQLDKDQGVAKKAQAPPPAPAVANAVAPQGGETKEAEKAEKLADKETTPLAQAPKDEARKAAALEEQKPQPKAPPSKRGGFGLEDQAAAQNWRDASPEEKAKELREAPRVALQDQAKQQADEADGKQGLRGGLDQPPPPPKTAPKPVSKARPAEFAKADKAPAPDTNAEGWAGGGKAANSAGDEALQRESLAKRATPKKKGKAEEPPPQQEYAQKDALAKEEAANRNKESKKESKEDERRTEVAAAEPAAQAPRPEPAPAQTVATASPQAKPAGQPQATQPAKPGFGVSANEATGRASTGSTSGGSYQLAPLSSQRVQGNDDSADLAGQAETAADKKRADADADFYRRQAAAEVTSHLEQAVKYGNGGQRMPEVKECLEALKLGAAGAQRLEALRRLCDAFNALGEPDQADQYCDRVVLEFPNSAYARQISEARHDVQRAAPARAAEKRPSAPMELDEVKKSKATKKAVDDAAY